MIVLDARVVIPRALVTETLRTLSGMYQGASKMRQRARLSVYWPHMDIDIANAAAIPPRMEHHLGFIFTALRSIQRPRGGRDQIHEEARH